MGLYSCILHAESVMGGSISCTFISRPACYICSEDLGILGGIFITVCVKDGLM